MTTQRVLVKSKLPGGHYRAGLHFPREGRVISEANGLTEAQLKAIEDDANLVVGPAPAASEGEGQPSNDDVAEAARLASEAEAARNLAELESIRAERAELEKVRAELTEVAKSHNETAADLDAIALAREEAATKKPADKKKWEAAAAAAKTASKLDDAAWADLPAAYRVVRIEVELAKGAA